MGGVRKEAGGYSGLLLAWLVLAWFVLLVLGLGMMAGYSHSPGAARATGPAWPKALPFTPAADAPTLLVALHPRCTCSVATVVELGRLLTGVTVHPRIEILLYRPTGATAAWDRAAFEEELRQIPQARVQNDVEGQWARTFGMLTSGDVALFTPAGRLLFRGGITRARGHEGESAGGRQLRRALLEGYGDPGAIPVFGCPLETVD